ncbi:CpXC domain-containing protein [Thermoplasmatales archaeon AK]|nr:CpXC domain-containing protein [Thermoplasmatales archaeon AK]
MFHAVCPDCFYSFNVEVPKLVERRGAGALTVFRCPACKRSERFVMSGSTGEPLNTYKLVSLLPWFLTHLLIFVLYSAVAVLLLHFSQNNPELTVPLCAFLVLGALGVMAMVIRSMLLSDLKRISD